VGHSPWHRLISGARTRPTIAFALPAFILVGCFYILPNALNFVLAATDWSATRPSPSIVGWRNVEDLAGDTIVWNALWTTIRFALIVMVAANVVALALAVALEGSGRFNLVLRTVFFLPVLVSPLAAGYVFLGILGTDGALNQLIDPLAVAVGLPAPSVQWLGDMGTTLTIVALVHAWKYGGIHMLVYLAGLKAIPEEVVQAARIDGASRWDLIRRVKLPLLGPAFTFNITLSLIGALAAFDIILAMTKGGPARATEVLNLVVFREFGTGRFAFATTIGLLLFVVILAVAIPLIAYLRRREVTL
jgi:raffinose/stachyose/melibiose transport system permease protein